MSSTGIALKEGEEEKGMQAGNRPAQHVVYDQSAG